MGKKREKIGLCSLERESSGLTVTVKIGQARYVIRSVPENIIRCEIDAMDVAYLLDEQPNPEWQEGDDPEDEFIRSGPDESLCFTLSPSVFKDCMRYGDPIRDITGSMDFKWV